MHDVFISFSFNDQSLVEDIVNQLTTKYGFSCWICTKDIDGGKRYKALIPQAIDDAKAVIFVQSESALASKEIPKEIGIAFDAGKPIIPFKLDSSQPQGELRYDLYGVEYIDGTKPTLEQRIYDLAVSIGNAIGRPLSIATQGNLDSMLASTQISCSEIFMGRDKLLAEIHEAFTERNVVFLQGMGGIGKSAIACHYWKHHRDFYSTVVWARYTGDLITLIADDSVFAVSSVLRKTNPDGTLQSDEEYARQKLKTIKSSSDEHTLIILDNYDVQIDTFFGELMENAPYRVLVTTRIAPERGLYHTIPIKALDDDALKTVFIEYANPSRTFIDFDDPHFPELLALTNRHTFTLELLAKYMDEKSMDDIEELVLLLRESGLKFLDDSDKKQGYSIIRKLFNINRLSTDETSFLHNLALMSERGVDQRMFKKWCGSIFSSRSRLVDLGLISINGENRTISMHPIIREIVWEEIKANPNPANYRAFLENIVDTLRRSWMTPYNENLSIADCMQSASSIFPLFTFSKDDEGLFLIWSTFPNFLWQVGRFSASIEIAHTVYDTCLRHCGEASMMTGFIAKMVGGCYFNSRQTQDSIPWYIQGLRSMQLSGVTLDDELALAYEKVARCYTWEYIQDFDKADKHFKKALELRTEIKTALENGQQVVSAVKPWPLTLQGAEEAIASVMTETGRMYQQRLDFKTALEYAQRSQAIFKRVNPHNVSSISYTYYDTGVCYYHLGMQELALGNDAATSLFEQAKQNLHIALESNTKMRGAYAIDTIDNAEYLADTYRALRQHADATNYYMLVLSMLETLFGKEHPRIDSVKAKMNF